MRREVYVQNEDGTRSDVVKERTYDLKSKTQGRMIQVSIPASVPVRDYPYNAVVDLVGARFGAVAHATFGDNRCRLVYQGGGYRAGQAGNGIRVEQRAARPAAQG